MLDASKMSATETLASQGFCTKYSYDEHVAMPLAEHLQAERVRYGITEFDWQICLAAVREGLVIVYENMGPGH